MSNVAFKSYRSSNMVTMSLRNILTQIFQETPTFTFKLPVSQICAKYSSNVRESAV